jgi:cytochrome P450
VSRPNRGRCDLLHDFATQLPSLVIGELIGIRPERRLAFLEWTEALITANPAGEWEKNPFAEIYREFAKLLEEEELLGFCFLLVVGGNDTTTNLIANGAVLLARHPEQRAALVGDASLIPHAIEELLPRMPEYELEAEPAWQASAWARAYAGVPIRFGA